ncbi:hypothetical protein DFJ74DRAFT_661108 [Hyaloraphidium curvatum]|nr:hypothetical protein DFJ74DRAFT_661108 [Hyaloraphidium curvatum]
MEDAAEKAPKASPFPAFSSWSTFTSSLTTGLATTLDYVKETAAKTVKTIEEETEKRLGEFEKERQEFVRQKKEANEYFADEFPDAEPVWKDGSVNEDELRRQVLGLSSRNFLVEPPAGTDFEFDLPAVLPSAMATLRADPALEKMRFALVPSHIKEKAGRTSFVVRMLSHTRSQAFWSNYFYRVGLIKQALALSAKLDEVTQEGAETKAEESGAEAAVDDLDAALRAEIGEDFSAGPDDDLAGGLGEAGKEDTDAAAWEAELQDLLKS